MEAHIVLESFRLDNRVALVTGGNRGLGRAMAVALAQAGADVAVTSRSGDAEATIDSVNETGHRCAGFSADFSDPAIAQDLVTKVISEFGRIDILVNNAGTIRRAPALEYSLEDWRHVIDVNLTAVWAMCQAVGHRMVEQGGEGRIINIASLLSFQGGVTVPAYAAAKHAVAGLTRSLANEWAPLSINVNALAPGYMLTDNTEALQNDAIRYRQILERIPAERWGEPDDMAGAVVFLASDASRYVHGQVLAVDGGWLGR